MPKYRVTVRVSSTEIVEADNPYMAAVAAAERHGSDVEVADVRPAVGRAPSAAGGATAKTAPAKKRRALSPEARAKLAKNLEKARAARARNLKAAKKTAKKTR
jgi:hypothetical protein